MIRATCQTCGRCQSCKGKRPGPLWQTCTGTLSSSLRLLTKSVDLTGEREADSAHCATKAVGTSVLGRGRVLKEEQIRQGRGGGMNV